MRTVWETAAQKSGHFAEVLFTEMQDDVVECESAQGSESSTPHLRSLRSHFHGQQGIQILLPSMLLCLNAQVANPGIQAASCRFFFCPSLISTRQMGDKYTARVIITRQNSCRVVITPENVTKPEKRVAGCLIATRQERKKPAVMRTFSQKVTTLISYQNQRCWVVVATGIEPVTPLMSLFKPFCKEGLRTVIE